MLTGVAGAGGEVSEAALEEAGHRRGLAAIGPSRRAVRPRLRAGSDAKLVQRAQAGDVEALEQLFRRHWPAAHRVAFLVVHDACAAEDIAQEAFLAAVRALDRFDRRRPFAPWLHWIAVNRAIDFALGAGAAPGGRRRAGGRSGRDRPPATAGPTPRFWRSPSSSWSTAPSSSCAHPARVHARRDRPVAGPPARHRELAAAARARPAGRATAGRAPVTEPRLSELLREAQSPDPRRPRSAPGASYARRRLTGSAPGAACGVPGSHSPRRRRRGRAHRCTRPQPRGRGGRRLAAGRGQAGPPGGTSDPDFAAGAGASARDLGGWRVDRAGQTGSGAASATTATRAGRRAGCSSSRPRAASSSRSSLAEWSGGRSRGPSRSIRRPWPPDGFRIAYLSRQLAACGGGQWPGRPSAARPRRGHSSWCGGPGPSAGSPMPIAAGGSPRSTRTADAGCGDPSPAHPSSGWRGHPTGGGWWR